MCTKNKKIFTLILAILLSLLLLSSCGTTQNGDSNSGSDSDGQAAENLDPIKIGAVLSQTGTVAHAGINGQNAMEILVDEVNAAGGIKGRMVELIIENSNTEPERAVSSALKLSNENKVLAIIGPDNSSTATAVKEQVTEVDEIVAISITGSSPKLTEDRPLWFFRGATPANYQTSSLTKYMVEELGYTKFAVMVDAALQDQADAFAADLAAYGLEPLAVETHKSGDTNFNGQLLSIKGTNPEAIFFVGYVTEGASALKQARDLGIEAQFAGSIGIVYEEFCQVGGSITEGVLGTIGFTSSNPDPKVQEFVKKFEEKTGELPDHAAGQAYDQLSLVLEAIRQQDISFNPDNLAEDRTLIRDWLENDANGFEGLTAVISYTPEEHTAYKAVNVMVVEGGHWTVLKASDAQ